MLIRQWATMALPVHIAAMHSIFQFTAKCICNADIFSAEIRYVFMLIDYLGCPVLYKGKKLIMITKNSSIKHILVSDMLLKLNLRKLLFDLCQPHTMNVWVLQLVIPYCNSYMQQFSKLHDDIFKVYYAPFHTTNDPIISAIWYSFRAQCIFNVARLPQ